MNKLYGYDSFSVRFPSGCGGLVRIGLRLGWLELGQGLGWVRAWVGLGLVKTSVSSFYTVHGWVICYISAHEFLSVRFCGLGGFSLALTSFFLRFGVVLCAISGFSG